MAPSVGRPRTRRSLATHKATSITTTRSASRATSSLAPLKLPTDVVEISDDDIHNDSQNDDGDGDSDDDVVLEKVVPAPRNTPFAEYGGYYSPTGGAVKPAKKKRKVVPAAAAITPKTPEQELQDTTALAARMFEQHASLVPEITSMYSQVAWCRLRGWPYWPGYVCSPQMLAVDADTMETFVPLMKTHYWIYFYHCNKSAAVPHSSVVPWDDQSKPYRDGYPTGGVNRTIGLAEAVDVAEKEYKLAADDRVAWVVTRVRKKVLIYCLLKSF
ncbi:hypothetical protein, variant [Aphanomyces astaci]|uniref:PWWP domain-containing protein n=1 Tax=Aphanomyces astaci TaxID=112090 RepID=W4FL76_APHAT|nr:hypothetical protein, variant [Aphanomyces astaci]ETV68277.1 hypothetical protein, variant [Aphanomyces astaci]|eukprot:XP_009842219.1 hypothetical protein, variant [Aphanomyces astaci]